MEMVIYGLYGVWIAGGGVGAWVLVKELFHR
jgi:hypothetical protein